MWVRFRPWIMHKPHRLSSTIVGLSVNSVWPGVGLKVFTCAGGRPAPRLGTVLICMRKIILKISIRCKKMHLQSVKNGSRERVPLKIRIWQIPFRNACIENWTMAGRSEVDRQEDLSWSRPVLAHLYPHRLRYRLSKSKIFM